MARTSSFKATKGIPDADLVDDALPSLWNRALHYISTSWRRPSPEIGTLRPLKSAQASRQMLSMEDDQPFICSLKHQAKLPIL